MEENIQIFRVNYWASLLGNIGAHLQSLQGYDTMALELLQNADDAKAKKIVFDIQDDGLKVWNSGVFSSCGDLNNECTFDGANCDFHRLIEFGSGGKQVSSENIGRFGIGFVSTYQVTDYPVVVSNNLKIKLEPEIGEAEVSIVDNTRGTKFFLPWANSESDIRRALHSSPVTDEHIEQVFEDCQKVLRHSLLFLKNLQQAEVRRNGQLELLVELERDQRDLIVSFKPENKSEHWLILDSTINKNKKKIAFDKYSELERANRKDKISIAIGGEGNLDSDNGLLYAFLPTQKSTGLPLHINGDFFPESSRKSLVFEGGQERQYWNELLIETAANTISDNLELLRDEIGHKQLWNLLDNALKTSRKSGRDKDFPACFISFWDCIKDKVESGIKICLSAENKHEKIKDLFAGQRQWSKEEINVFHQIGGKLVHEDLIPYRNTLLALGVQDLKIKNLISILENTGTLPVEGGLINNNKLNSFYRPIWSITNSLLNTSHNSEEINVTLLLTNLKLKEIPFVVDTNFRVSTINQLYKATDSITSVELAKAFIFCKFVHDDLQEFDAISKLIDCFELGIAVVKMQNQIEELDKKPEEFLPSNQSDLYSLYSLISKLDNQEIEDDEEIYEELISLPIWRTDSGFSALDESLLPGDFQDPTGEAKLLNRLYLSPTTEEFLKEKLGVKRQTIEEYVRVVVPKVFDENGPSDIRSYQDLIKIFADHSSLIDNKKIADLLTDSHLIPDMSGGWRSPKDVYFKTQDLIKLLGDFPELWVNEDILPSEKSVHIFVESLGVTSTPNLNHIIDRIYNLSQEHKPSDDIKELSENAFYKLCEIYDDYEEDERYQDQIIGLVRKLMHSESLPIIGDNEGWHEPWNIFAPYNYQAFESQADILAFLDTRKLSRTLLEDLQIEIEPGLADIVNHLLDCISNNKSAHQVIYQELDKIAKNINSKSTYETQIFEKLKNERCIWHSEEIGYVRPNQVFYTKQNLGDYAFNIPQELNKFKSFFDLVGVKDAPELSDYIDIIIKDIIESYSPTFGLVSPKDKKIYKTCIEQIIDLNEKTADGWEATGILTEYHSILNIKGSFCYPEDVLIDDSEWYKNFFRGESFDWLSKLDKKSQLLFTKLGTKKLSEVATLELDYRSGDERYEDEKLNRVKNRFSLYTRILQELDADFLNDFKQSIEKLIIVSHDKLMVRANIVDDNLSIVSEPISVNSFFDRQNNKLYLVRPVADDDIDIFKPLMHTLLPVYTDTDIMKIVAIFDQMSTLTIEKAGDYLDRLGYSDSSQVVIDDVDSDIDISSPDMNTIGSGDLPVNEDKPSTDKDNEVIKQEPTETSRGRKTEKVNKDNGTSHPSNIIDSSLTPPGKPRQKPKYKKEHDKRLLSYVKSRSDLPSKDKTNQEIKLEIESLSRKLVHEYEISRGRKPIDMSPQNPGYDIESINEETGVIERFIEIKGTTGDWKDMGVSVSRTQFIQAQEYGDNYWLYVVDNVYKNNAKAYAIQNPAMKISKYMFDGGWKSEAEEVVVDETSKYKVGVRINHEDWGFGKITEVVERAGLKQLTILFDDGRNVMMSLNITRMPILDEDE